MACAYRESRERRTGLGTVPGDASGFGGAGYYHARTERRRSVQNLAPRQHGPHCLSSVGQTDNSLLYLEKESVKQRVAMMALLLIARR